MKHVLWLPHLRKYCNLLLHTCRHQNFFLSEAQFLPVVFTKAVLIPQWLAVNTAWKCEMCILLIFFKCNIKGTIGNSHKGLCLPSALFFFFFSPYFISYGVISSSFSLFSYYCYLSPLIISTHLLSSFLSSSDSWEIAHNFNLLLNCCPLSLFPPSSKS